MLNLLFHCTKIHKMNVNQGDFVLHPLYAFYSALNYLPLPKFKNPVNFHVSVLKQQTFF